jgi:dihydrofolate reductase
MHVSLMVAITVDGKIARASNHYPDWTGKADKQLYVQITRKAGVMIMGSTTFDIIGRVLPGRKTIVMTRNPDRRSDRDDLVFTQAPPDEILNDLASQGYEEAVVVGGAKVNQVFAENGLIDELILTLSPHAFGTGLSIFSGAVDLKLSLKKILATGRKHPLPALSGQPLTSALHDQFSALRHQASDLGLQPSDLRLLTSDVRPRPGDSWLPAPGIIPGFPGSPIPWPWPPHKTG